MLLDYYDRAFTTPAKTIKFQIMKWDMRKTIKAAELKRAFNAIPDDHDVCFGPTLGNHVGSLTYFRTKWVGDNLVNIQFDEEFEVTRDPWEDLQKPQSDDGPKLTRPN